MEIININICACSVDPKIKLASIPKIVVLKYQKNNTTKIILIFNEELNNKKNCIIQRKNNVLGIMSH